MTSEQAYEQAQADEVRWEADCEGTLAPESAADPTRPADGRDSGRVWQRGRQDGLGRP